MNQLANLFVVAGPSGVGKTKLVEALLNLSLGLEKSISFTTRPKRSGEVEGSNYHFIDKRQFQIMIEKNDFLEHALVFDHYYGTNRSWVMNHLEKGRDVLLEIDWQGAQSIRQTFPEAITIFILPPSRAVLEKRLIGRGQDSDAVIAARMSKAIAEISHYHEFDYLIINQDFDQALAEISKIVETQRLRCACQAQIHRQLLSDLLSL